MLENRVFVFQSQYGGILHFWGGSSRHDQQDPLPSPMRVVEVMMWRGTDPFIYSMDTLCIHARYTLGTC